MPYYLNPVNAGLEDVISNNDGYSIDLSWHRAYASRQFNKIGYNIYYSENLVSLFEEGPKFFVKEITRVQIPHLTPGVLYHFGVRAVEYDPLTIDLNSLSAFTENLLTLPTTVLISDIGESDNAIPILNPDSLPTYGIVKIGAELIRYGAIDLASSSLKLAIRGYLGTTPTIHQTNGYDGNIIRNPLITYFLGDEEQNPHTYQGQCRFDINHYSYTITDGYKQLTKDLLTTDLTSSDQYNEDFPSYDYSGYHRTDPVQLLNGVCVGSYIGGEMYCADGYSGVGNVLRGLSVQDQNNQRQEMLLSITGEPVVLLQRQRTGYRCKCFLPSSEHPDDRCQKCFGTGFVVGYQQYFNPRRSDGRIMTRFSPTEESLKTTETGLESDMAFDCWSLTVPTIKNRDVLIRFDQDGNEEFRYEVMNVGRNRMLQSLMGGQKFRVQRIRKTDTAYRILSFRNTEKIPQKIYTSISSGAGIPPHAHTIVINENITSLTQINQLTGMSQGHTHRVVNGEIVGESLEGDLGHTHNIILNS